MSEGKLLAEEILHRHKDDIESGNDPEKEKRDEAAEKDMIHWEIGGDR